MNERLYNLMDWAEIEAVTYAETDNPHSLLGAQVTDDGILIQTFIPTAASVSVVCGKKSYPMELEDEAGFFAALIPAVLSAVWVSHLQIGTFWLLVFAAILFFGLYGIVLLLLKEPLVKEIVFGLLSKLKRKNKADDVA